ncbi:MAG TPA: DUF3090 domain-containing protein [Anaerolineae bacterium]|jgi:uncharacterized repeat protein (TIGR03847 family)|nr:DUF3090 domain-containing protein [Anaerolineae bacterium]
MTDNIELTSVSAITADAVGQPGQRVFYVQARQGLTTVTIETEKEQVRALSLGIHQFLEELIQRFPDRTELDRVDPRDLDLTPPFEPEFKVAQMGLGYDAETDRVVIVAEALNTETEDEPAEEASEESGPKARFWITRGQAKALADHALEIVAQGRPLCPLCGRPMNAEGHFCPKRNGHTKDLIVP